MPKNVQTHTTGMANTSTWKRKLGKEVSEAAAGCG